MASQLPPFNIMCKPVCGTCNLNCSYCYYTHKPKALYPGVNRFEMSDDVLESYTRQYLQAMPVHCDFNWQGGEPTLAGLDFFRRAVELQQHYKTDGQNVVNSFQTNGTLLNDEWCEFFAENNVLVGVSLDGPPQWHDSFRLDHAGRPSFHRAWAGLEMLRNHSVEFNVLVTLNSANAPHGADIYRYFVNRSVRYLQFIPILERDDKGNPTDFSCTPEQFGRFALDVLRLWLDRDIGKVSVRLIDALMHTILFGVSSLCCYSTRCANAHVLEFNGDLYACDHFVERRWLIGNIMDRPLTELIGDPLLAEFAALKTDLPQLCRDCRYLQFCNAGCPKHHMPIGTDRKRYNYFCEGLKTFFAEAVPVLRQITPYLQQSQVALQHNKIHADPASGKSSRLKPAPASRKMDKLKRNDPCPCGSGLKYKQCCGRNRSRDNPLIHRADQETQTK